MGRGHGMLLWVAVKLASRERERPEEKLRSLTLPARQRPALSRKRRRPLSSAYLTAEAGRVGRIVPVGANRKIQPKKREIRSGNLTRRLLRSTVLSRAVRRMPAAAIKRN